MQIARSHFAPVYTFEFWMTYLGRIHFVTQHKWYQKLGGSSFDFQLRHPLAEQLLYFCILSLFWLMISCTYLSISIDQNKYLKAVYYEKILHPKASRKWKFSFVFFRYIHLGVLLAMFLNGMQRIDCLENLTYILFFVIFLTFDKIYRKFSIIMVIFMCTEIVLQYYFGLKYHTFITDPKAMWRIQWFGFILCDKYTDAVFYEPVSWQALQKECVQTAVNFPNWKKDSSVYFRHLPYFKNVVMLVVLSMLHQINYIFKDDLEVNRM